MLSGHGPLQQRYTNMGHSMSKIHFVKNQKQKQNPN